MLMTSFSSGPDRIDFFLLVLLTKKFFDGDWGEGENQKVLESKKAQWEGF